MPLSFTCTSSTFVFLPLFFTTVYYFRNDAAEYEEFKLQTDSIQRRAFYKKWTVRSFFHYSGLTVFLLLMIGRLNAVAVLPGEFSSFSVTIQNNISADNSVINRRFLLMLIVIFIVTSLVSPTLIAYLTRGNANNLMAGNIQPLLPRNGSEKFWGVVISVNAGISEELFFRLTLPLLLFYILGNAVAAFTAAAILFGLVHLYQGWAGVMFTFVLGIVLTLVYLGTGQLWIVIIAHAAINLNGLILQPFLTARLR